MQGYQFHPISQYHLVRNEATMSEVLLKSIPRHCFCFTGLRWWRALTSKAPRDPASQSVIGFARKICHIVTCRPRVAQVIELTIERLLQRCCCCCLLVWLWHFAPLRWERPINSGCLEHEQATAKTHKHSFFLSLAPLMKPSQGKKHPS